MKNRKIIAISLTFVFCAVILVIANYLMMILAPFFIALVLHFALKPFVNLLEVRGLNKTTSVTIVFSMAFFVFFFMLYLIIPAIISEISTIQDNFDFYSKVIIDKYNAVHSTFASWSGPVFNLLAKKNAETDIFSYFQESVLFFIQKIPQHIFTLLPVILNIIVIPFATFFFLLDDHRIKKTIIGIVPNRYFEVALIMVHKLHRQFGFLLMGMLADALIVAILASVGLWIIGLKYPIIVGIFAGATNLIPYFGPVVGTVIAFFVALITGSSNIMFLYILLVFLVVNLLENIFVQPIVFSRAANLHPLLVIFLVLAGSKIAGVIGMLLAVPCASLFQVVIKIIYNEFKRPVLPDFSKYSDVSN